MTLKGYFIWFKENWQKTGVIVGIFLTGIARMDKGTRGGRMHTLIRKTMASLDP